MQQPPTLQAGDMVRIISTARKISEKELQPAVQRLESWDLKVEFGNNLFQEDRQFAGTKTERIADLQAALDDESCKAIICARGGYGTVQLIDEIDFNKFLQKPKWLVGYSDVTVLHCHLHEQLQVESIHASMPINFLPIEEVDVAAESLRKALFGEELTYSFEAEEGSLLTFEQLQVPIVGGNLSILYSLSGSKSQLSSKGKFLFIEDLDEYLYHIDRMMVNLRRSALLNGCCGLLVGGLTDMNDNTIPYGETAKEIVVENTKDLGIPIVFGVPAGHIKENKALIMGRKLKLSREGSKVKMTFDGRAQ